MDYIENYKQILQENEYGFLPDKPISVKGVSRGHYERVSIHDACKEVIDLSILMPNGEINFPITLTKPKVEGKVKTVVAICFEPEVPNRFLPHEVILDKGWAICSFCYEDVTTDDGNFENKAAKILKGDKDNSPGKIAMWAWAASRVLDYLYQRDDIDLQNVAVAGHSRLGKTALLAGAFDDRFRFVHSNNSGSGGAGLYSLRNKDSESIAHLCRVFPFWFCNNFKKFIDKEYDLPFDQHMLLSLIAPRYLSVSSSKEDLWANPYAEQKCAEKASYVWNNYGKKGLIISNKIKLGKKYNKGSVSYFVREGYHYFSSYDWSAFLDFCDKNLI